MLVLFDVDGTLLLRSGAAHLAALADTVFVLTGSRPQVRSDGVRHEVGGVAVNGMVDAEIAAVMLSAVRGPAAVESVRRVLQRLGPQYRDTLASGAHPGEVAPGVVPLLDTLTGSGARLGVATGNTRGVAVAKLAAAGLGGRFRLGGFSDATCTTRRDVVATALLHARPGEDVWLVGDTPADIDAGHANGVRVLATATGVYDVDDLGDADVVVTDLTDPRAAEMLLGVSAASGA